MTGTRILSASGLACRRGDRILWRGIDLAIHTGHVTQVSGANGAGKSSLLRVLAGLLPSAAGSVERHMRAALIDETLALDPALTLGRALGFWARLDRVDDKRVSAALATLRIAHLADVPVRILSTGQRKRAALARVLMTGAPLWLLDEPANGLDIDGVALLEGMIATHRAGGGAVVLASHQTLRVPDTALLPLAEFQPA